MSFNTQLGDDGEITYTEGVERDVQAGHVEVRAARWVIERSHEVNREVPQRRYELPVTSVVSPKIQLWHT